MKLAQLALLATGFLLLGGGYLASVLLYGTEQQANYYKQVDQPTVAVLALLLFVGAIVCGLIPQKQEDKTP